MSCGDVVNVEKDLLPRSSVPYSVARVSGVLKDRIDCALAPGPTIPVGIASAVVGTRGGNTGAGQALGDGVDAPAGGVLGEDALDDGCGDRVDIEALQALAVRGLGGVGMRAGVG